MLCIGEFEAAFHAVEAVVKPIHAAMNAGEAFLYSG